MQDGLDMIVGAKAIGSYMGLSQRQVYNMIEVAGLPVFKVGKLLTARKATLSAWLTSKEAAQ